MPIVIHGKSLAVTAMTLFLSVLACKATAAGAAAAHLNPRAVVAASQPTPPGGIYEHKAIKIGGVDQWITIRGNKPQNPILLFIHGGPGSPMMPQSWTFQRPWEDYFTVVQWDQRGAGKTFSAAHRKVDKTLTIERMQADAEELIDWLRHTYGKDKIFVMGHSWGSVLGLRIAQHRPESVFAYIGVGQVINLQRNEAVGYALTLARAEAVGNAEAVRQLKAMAPYPNPDGSLTVAQLKRERVWAVALGGMRYAQPIEDDEAIYSMSPDYNDYDVKSADIGSLRSLEVLWSQVMAVDFDGVTEFKCPVIFFAGAQDRTTPTSIVEEFYARVQTEKKLFKYERAAHYVVNEAPGEVLMDLVLHVRPYSGIPAPN